MENREPTQPTHIAIPVETYQALGKFLTSMPYGQVVHAIQGVERSAVALIYDDVMGHYLPQPVEAAGDSETG